jgi:type IV pilus assembly protein PilM
MGMFRLGSPKFSLGIDIGTSSLKFIQMKKTKQGPQIVAHGLERYPPGIYQDGVLQDSNALVQIIRSLKKEHNLKFDQVFTGISSQSTILRFFPLPEMDDAELKHAIDGEAEQYVPYPLDTVNLHYAKLDRFEQEGMSRLLCLLAVAQKQHVDSLVDLFKSAGIKNLDALDIDSLAMINALDNYLNRGSSQESATQESAEETDIETEALESSIESSTEEQGPSEDEVTAIVCIGARKTVINVLKGRVLRFSRTSPASPSESLGGEVITEVIKSVYKVPFEEAEEIKIEKSRQALDGSEDQEFSDVIHTTVEEIAVEIRRSFDYYKAQHREPVIHRVILTGGTAKLKDIEVLLSNELSVDVEVGDPSYGLLRDMDSEELFEENLQEYGVAIGLALRGCDEEGSP